MDQKYSKHKGCLKDNRASLYQIIFGIDTRAGRIFDVILTFLIILSIIVVLLESVVFIRIRWSVLLNFLEWFFTIIFSVEFLLRIYCVRNPFRYVTSYYGIIDLVAILPSYISLFLINGHSLLMLRSLRLMRIFRIFKLARFVREMDYILSALRKSRPKIIVFLGAVFTIVLIMGTLMYMFEGEANGFTNIPISMYWAIVTLTTVGYGDITPATVLGQILSSIIMVLGYAMIAVPTGIVSVEYVKTREQPLASIICNVCGKSDLTSGSHYCNKCGAKILAHSD